MMIDAIKNALAIESLKRAGIFGEMRVVDRDGVRKTRFVVRHHGVVSTMQRAAAVQLARTMRQFAREDEFKTLVWDE